MTVVPNELVVTMSLLLGLQQMLMNFGQILEQGRKSCCGVMDSGRPTLIISHLHLSGSAVTATLLSSLTVMKRVSYQLSMQPAPKRKRVSAEEREDCVQRL